MASNAASYAVNLLPDQGINFQILHAIGKPIESRYNKPEFNDLEIEAHANLEKLIEDLSAVKGSEEHVFNSKVKGGNLSDSIEELIAAQSFDLIVMGAHGRGGRLESFIGSSTNDVIRHVDCPVLIVPHEASYAGLKSLVFAMDNQEFTSVHVLHVLRYLTALHDSKLIFLHISEGLEEKQIRQRDKLVLEQYFRNQNYEFENFNHEDVLDGLQEYLLSHMSDALVMLNRKRGILERLFDNSKVEEMSFRSKVPLLIFHDN